VSDYLIASAAVIDLEDIWDYYAIELQVPDVADSIATEIFDAFEKLAQTPGLGHFCTDLATKPVRFWKVRDYLIIYRGEKQPIEIVRILHGARDVQAVLGKRSVDDPQL
jgi:toxin ParE1/3/4